MVFANFFDKVSLSAAQRIKDYDRSGFEKILSSHRVGIVYGYNAIHSREGKIALDLTTRILARLYPSIVFIQAGDDQHGLDYTQELKSIAQGINHLIECADGLPPTVNLYIGEVEDYKSEVPGFYIGSDNWNASFSQTTAQRCNDSGNPFGAGAAVCFAAANLFRYIFRDVLGNPPLDNDITFSTITQEINTRAENPNLPASIPVSFTLVGTGAIGNGCLWGLLKLTGLEGSINLIDDQDVSLSNLQRYVLMGQDDIGKKKVKILQEMFGQFGDLTIQTYPEKWQVVAGDLSLEQSSLLATALDTQEDRIKIQSLLPKKIINAWTGPDSLGVSRHLDFERDLCLSCLYLPKEKAKDYSEKVAAALGMESADGELLIRKYLANHLPIDDQLIAAMSQAMNLPANDFLPFKGLQVSVFFGEAICGGKVVPVGGQNIEVPLAHESAFAGILLAAEIVIECLSLRQEPIEPLTKINLMCPLHSNLREMEGKHYSGICMCQDEVFVNRYRAKWMAATTI